MGKGGYPLPHPEPEGLDQGCPQAQNTERTGANTVGRPLLVSKIPSQSSVGQAFWLGGFGLSGAAQREMKAETMQKAPFRV